MRLFDTTERTGIRKHETGRKCHCCQSALRDTIVHFGEKVSNIVHDIQHINKHIVTYNDKSNYL